MNTKTMIRFFTIADFVKEEQWLREESKKGWRLTGMTPPCIYRFEECVPEDTIYKLDYKNGGETKDYMQMFEDYGWEYVTKCTGWLYFRKNAQAVEHDNDAEIFSDQESRLNMIQHVMKTRMLPLAIIFLCCVIPNFMRCFVYMEHDFLSMFFTVFWCFMFGFYTCILLYCGIKIAKMKKELK